ncbi:MAG: MYXO-CTERM sorting domain-containing protein [Minicystis sp.]
MRLALAAFTLATLIAAPAAAAPILAAPGSPGFDAGLESMAAGFQRQQDVFATLENGLALDPIFDPASVQSVKDFFAQTATSDFQAFSGKHPYEALASYDEHGDEGNFAGITSVGVAARLIVLRAENAPAAEIDRARAAAVRAAQAWHVYGAIGGPGVVARGVRRVTPWSAGDPPFPGQAPDLVPLEDGSNNPLPAKKSAVWRAPVADFPGWAWIDDTSKDQVSGYALAAAWLWDALRDDPLVPEQVTDDLAADLVAFAKALMEVTPELGIDLCIRDADGRLTSFHDLNPRQISPDSVLPESISLRNGFNAALALGVVRAAYHVSGDPAVGKFYYEDLVGKRDLPSQAATNAGVIFIGAATNYSNVNMLAIALATLGRFETDAYVRQQIQATLDKQFWSTGSDRDVSHVQQAWFDVVYGAYGTGHPAEIRTRVAGNLSSFQPAPAFERDVINCDDTEIAAGVCVGVDGTTMITLLPAAGHNGQVVAKDIVPKSIRPDSDFEWRSDPHTVNGTGSTKMDHGGDWLTAYWLGRASDLDDADKNLSPKARPALPYTLGEGGAGGGGGGGAGGAGGAAMTSSSSSSGAAPEKGGCSACAVGGEGDASEDVGAAFGVVAAAMAALGRRRRRG